MSTPVTLIPPTLPSGWCPTSEQERANAIIGGATAFIDSTLKTYIVGPNVPAVTDRDKLWFRTTDKLFYYWDGTSWIANYWHDPFLGLLGSIWMPTRAASDLLTVDHDGSAVIVGSEDRSGPFWQEDTLMRARFPLGAGTLAPSGDVIGSNATGGVDEVSSTSTANIFDHTHVFGKDNNPGNDDGRFLTGSSTTITSQNSMVVHGESEAESGAITAGNFITSKPIIGGTEVGSGDVEAMNILNPYQSGVWAKRTSRKYFSQ